MSETYTEEEVNQMIEEVRKLYKVRDVVCEKTGRRFPMKTWTYRTGVVMIDTTEGDEE
jgi:hypothetical protein